MSRRREEQDMLDKVILGALKKGDVRWTALEKKVLTTCHSFATRTSRSWCLQDYRERNKIHGSNLTQNFLQTFVVFFDGFSGVRRVNDCPA